MKPKKRKRSDGLLMFLAVRVDLRMRLSLFHTLSRHPRKLKPIEPRILPKVEAFSVETQPASPQPRSFPDSTPSGTNDTSLERPKPQTLKDVPNDALKRHSPSSLGLTTEPQPVRTLPASASHHQPKATNGEPVSSIQRPTPDTLSSLRLPTPSEQELIESIAKESNTQVIWELETGECIRGRDLARLINGDWLNSEIINTYFTLLKLRCNRYHEVNPRVYCFSSFFFSKYQSAGYNGVQRWTKTTDLFSHDLVLFPINHSNLHWALVAAHLQTRRIEYYDSLLSGTDGRKILISIRDYLKQEAETKENSGYKLCDYDLHIMSVPQQMDRSSCGTFVCAYGDFLARGCLPPFSFTQADIKDLQLGLAADILRGYLP